MYSIEIENLGEIKRLFNAMPKVVDGELSKSVKKAGAYILGVEKGEVPVKTGALRRAIAMEYFSIGIKVGPNSNYAQWVHFGTGLYGPRHDFIRPKRAKVLAFKVGGKMVYAKYTRGQKANPFVERTVAKSSNPVNSIFDQCLTNIMEKL